MVTNKFFSLSNLPQIEPVPCGSKEYEWQYLDAAGNLKTDKKNVYEEIQSNLIKTDYKRKIKEGNLENDGPGIFMDTTKFDGGYASVDNLLANLADAVRSQTVQPQDNGAGTTSETPKDIETNGETAKPIAGNQETDNQQRGGNN